MELQALAAAAGVAISRSRQSKMEAERRQQELDTIQAVIAAISQADLQSFASVLELILEKGMELVGAKVGVIMLRDARSALLRSIAVRGFPSLNLPILQPISEGIVGRAARTLESQLARNVNESPWKDIYRPTVPETISELAVPIVDRSGAVGVINFEASTPGAFSELARARGESLARQVLLVLSCIEHFQEPISHEQVVRLVADRLDDANLDRDACLRVVLTGVTAGQGLGFSRAMLFVLEGSIPKPVVALGALTRTEAEAVWTELDARFAHWRDSTPEGESSGRQAERMLRRLLDAASVTISGDSGTPLERFLRSCAGALVDPKGALAQCIHTGEARILASGAQDPLRSELRRMAGNGVASETWFVPVMYENRTLGALVVDSEFLPEAQQPPTRARLRTGSEQALLEVVQRFAQLLGTIVARGSVW
jgi:GAF domain-containing protein